MTGKFLIEDNWYLIADENSWNIAKKNKEGKTKAEFSSTTYHHTPEDAIKFYLAKKQRESASKAEDGTLKDLVTILSSERDRLSETLAQAFNKACSLELKNDQTR